MNLARLLVFLTLVTLVVIDLAEARQRSRSKNSIRKKHDKIKKMKENTNSIRRRKYSKNAFRNSDDTKAHEDEDYFDNAPIINIRFRRGTPKSIFPVTNSVLLRTLRM